MTRELPESEGGSSLLGSCHASEKVFSQVTEISIKAKQVNLSSKFTNEAKQGNILGIKHKRATQLIWDTHLEVFVGFILCLTIDFKVSLPNRLDFKAPLLQWREFLRISENIWWFYHCKSQDCWLPCSVGEVTSPFPPLPILLPYQFFPA